MFKNSISLFTLSLLIFTFSPQLRAADPELPEGNLGEVRYSILKEPDFQALYGSEWILMDGRDIQGTQLHSEFGFKRAPDARGRFLRCRNGDDKVGSNPETLALGSTQEDAFQGHGHRLELAGTGLNIGSNECSAREPVRSVFQRASCDGSARSWQAGPVFETTDGVPRTCSETRPKNLTVNAFIKINVTKESRSAQVMKSLNDEIQNVPEKLLNNKEFVDALAKRVRELNKK